MASASQMCVVARLRDSMNDFLKKLYFRTNKINFKVSVSVLVVFFSLYYHYIFNASFKFSLFILEKIFETLDNLALYAFAPYLLGILTLIVLLFYKNRLSKLYVTFLYILSIAVSYTMVVSRYPFYKYFVYLHIIAPILYLFLSNNVKNIKKELDK